MSVPSISAAQSERNTYLEKIANIEAEELTDICLEHFSIPVIAGFSLDELTQEKFEKMGGKGPKPEPLSSDKKATIYQRISEFFKPKLKEKILELVKHSGASSLSSLSDEDLRARSEQLEKLKGNIDTYPNWNNLSRLFKDHTCLFKDLKKQQAISRDPMLIHEEICPIMSHYRDSGELFYKINLNQFI